MASKNKKTLKTKEVTAKAIKESVIDLIASQLQQKMQVTGKGEYYELTEDISEFLENFIVIGYNYNGVPVILCNTKTAKDSNSIAKLMEDVKIQYGRAN